MTSTVQQPGGYRTLIVEDEADVAELLRRYLTMSNVSVDVANDGETAWRKFQESPPHLVLCDLMLPRLSGSELIHRIRGHHHNARTPVVVISAGLHDADAETELCSKLDVNAAFRKPLALKELLKQMDGFAWEYARRARKGSTLRGTTPVTPPATAEAPPTLKVAQIGRVALQRKAEPVPASWDGAPRLSAVPDIVTEFTPGSTADADKVPSSTSIAAPLQAAGPLTDLGVLVRHGAATLASVSAVMVAAFDQRAQCVMHVHDGDARRSLYFHDGLVVSVATTLREESLANQLVRDGVIDELRARQVWDAVQAAGARFGEVAARLLGMPAARIVEALERQTRRVATEALITARGRYEVHPWKENAVLAGALRLDPLELIQVACLRAASSELVLEELSVREELQLMAGDAFNERVLIFSRLCPQSGIPSAVMDFPQLATVLARVGKRGLDGMRELLALILSQALIAGNPETVEWQVQRTAVLSSGPSEWTPENLPATSQAIRESVAAEWVRTGGRNAYDVLGVTPDASDAAIRIALHDATQRFGPPVLDDADLGPAKTYLEIIRARRTEAGRILLDPQERRTYNHSLAQAFMKLTAEG